MAIDNFIPEIWSASVETEYQAGQIVIPTVTGKYDGEIRKGNQVNITGAVTPSIRDYASTRSIEAEDLDDKGQTLLIDQEKAWSILVDDIDEAQAAGDLGVWAGAAGRGLQEVAEAFMINRLLTQSFQVNVTGSAPRTVNSYSTAKAEALTIRKTLNDNKVPVDGRFLLVNSAFGSLLVDGLSDAALAGGSNELRNGQIARVWGFTVLESPHFTEQTKPIAIGYHTSSAAFAGQIQKTESLRHQTKFADIVRGLHVYGGKVIRREAVAASVSAGVAQSADPGFDLDNASGAESSSSSSSGV